MTEMLVRVRCQYCFAYAADDQGPIDVTPDGGREWQRLGHVCARCRKYLTGYWREARRTLLQAATEHANRPVSGQNVDERA